MHANRIIEDVVEITYLWDSYTKISEGQSQLEAFQSSLLLPVVGSGGRVDMQERDEIPVAKEILNRPSEGIAGRIHILHYCNYLMGNHLSEVGRGGGSSAVANGCLRSIWEGELQEASVYA